MALAVQFGFPLLGGLLTGLAALAAVLWLAPVRGRGLNGHDSDLLSEPRWFRFREGYLVEHSGNVSFLLPPPIDHLKAWDELVDALSDIDDAVPAACAALRDAGRAFKLAGTFGSDQVVILGSREGEYLRIAVSTADARRDTIRVDVASLTAMEGEVAVLARAGDTSPTPSWATNSAGQVVWANKPYLAIVESCIGPDAAHGWPIHVLFPEAPSPEPGAARRKLVDRDGEEHWFEVTATTPGPDGVRHVHATSLDAMIRAEESLRSFIQTLTRSFAALPTGLAIFDREGHLALFNPSLLDMTGLDPAWLSRRPHLSDFFDTLRAGKRLPEPRDYTAWRNALRDLGRGGSTSIHEETWNLSGGTTYRMIGRPQNDGSVTLMLENVSAQMQDSRTQWLERSVMGEVMDGMDEGYVVFDHDGRTMLSTDAARNIWTRNATTDADGTAAGAMPRTLEGCIALWKVLSLPTGLWADLRNMIREMDAERGAWTETLHLRDGRQITMQIKPLAEGRLVIGFTEDATLAAAQGSDTVRALHA
ncbi:PAS domain-containing protein [Jannaschia seosinensis]|uniref:PAS domain-containing protein n=1 Tax=Jannaschia seosinensis TaxID=313367 RepID=UPI0006E12E66|nr:PAS domain-containing protein [Jannaschia seosinensis]